jgi:hypothetical protein
MKPLHAIRLLVATAGLAGLSLQAALDAGDQERYLRLHNAPITLYPETQLSESSLTAFCNARARPADAIVVSFIDAFKGPARLAALGIQRGEIWIYVPADLDLTQNGRKHIEGAKGIVYVPGSRRPRILSAEARRIAESAAILGCRMIAGLERKEAKSLANVGDVARHASILTIYDNQRLSRGAAEYRKYIERLVKEARAANPTILIEVCISTGRDAAASKALAGVLWTCADLVDRIGIYCNDSAESRASLELYYKVLRGA